MLPSLPLLATRTGFALIAKDGVKFNLCGILGRVTTVAFTPVVADCVGENVSVFGKGGGNDAAANFGVTLEAVLSVLVPKVEGSV